MTSARRPALDQENRDRVATHHGTSFCVEAGAGTGKTSLMVRRIVDQVLHGTSISRIAAITFTEKAAAELKLRVRQELESASSGSAAAREALGRLDTSSISTIHGFAASLLRERPVEARLDPNFTQMDELAAGLLLGQAWEAWLEKTLARQNDPLKNALLIGFRPNDIRKLHDRLYKARRHLSALPAPPSRLEEARVQVAELVGSLPALMASCRIEDDRGLTQWQRVLALYEKTQAGLSVPGLIKFCSGKSLLNPKLGKQENWKADCGALQKKAAEQLRGIWADVRASVLTDLLRLLASPGGAVAAVEERKDAHDILDFDDLLLKARNLLAEDPGVRRYFQNQYDSVIVDEFQDTDPLQVEIVFFLCEKGAAARTWREVRLKPGKLCIVGDPKQSIYRFRGADIETYTEAKELIAAQGAVIPIQENFRAVRALVDWTNGVFRNVIRQTEAYQPDYQDLFTSQPDRPDSAPAVTILCPAGGGEKTGRKAEAAALVSAIKRIKAEQWPLRERGEGSRRPARWGDIAVLMRSLTESQEYEAAFRAAGIPYRLEGGKQFFARQEIHALVACLRCIDDPGDEIALAGALKSLFFGFSDEDLLRMRLATRALSYLKPPDPGTGEPSDLARALALLRALHEDRNRVSLGATLERLYRETHALEKHLLTYAGRQGVANLQKAVVKARAFEAVGGTTFRRFAQWLHTLTEELPQEAESALVESEEDAVQLLTIHKAKGLEFPIVLLANLTRRTDGDAALWNRASRTLECKVTVQGDWEFRTPGYDTAKEAEKQRAEAEEKRLLYVAATRARDYLLISEFLSKSPGEVFSLLELKPPAIPDETPEVTCEGVRWWRVPPLLLSPDPELSTAIEVESESGPTWEERRQAWMEQRRAALERAGESRAPQSASGLKALEGEDSFASPRVAAAQEAASALGIAYHRLLYRLDLPDLRRLFAAAHPGDRPDPPAYLDALAAQTALECGLESSGELLDLLRGPVSPRLASVFAAAGAISREVPFLLRLPQENGSGPGRSLWEGIIDVILEQADGALVILDYKTDNLKADDVNKRMDRYERQGRIYRLAVEQATGRKVSQVLFYFVRTGVVYGDTDKGVDNV